MGYPLVVRHDGTLSLPDVGPVRVSGMTIGEAELAIAAAYRHEKILKGEHRVLVNLLRKRTIRAMVVHDAPQDHWRGRARSFTEVPRRKISNVTLPSDRASTLQAIAEAGASLDSHAATAVMRDEMMSVGRSLREGDIIDVPAQSNRYYYTSGMLPAGQFPFAPGLTVQQAIARAGGNVTGYRPGRRSLGPTEIILLRGGTARRRAFRVNSPRTVQVQPGDVIALRYKPPVEVFGK